MSQMVPERRWTIAAAAQALRAGEVTAVELTEGLLKRVDETSTAINAWVSVWRDAAMKAAEGADKEMRQGNYRGPLHGIPLGVKDNIDVQGVCTTAGSRVRADHVADRDAAVVRNLREAGAVLMGALNMHEFGQGVTSENPHYGPVRNPWDRRRGAGGSSGGSGAAVAAQTCLGALGTDTGGSVRMPAALTGVTGLRPTYKRVSSDGIVPLAWSLDVCGPLTSTVEDASIMLAAMSRVRFQPPDFERPVDLASVTIGVLDIAEDDSVELDVKHSVRDALSVLEGSGARINPIAIPDMRVAQSILMILNFAEPPAWHARWFPGRQNEYGADVRATLLAGGCLSAWEYVNAQRARAQFTSDVLDALSGVDALVLPTVPFGAPLLSTEYLQGGGDGDAASMIDGAVKFNALASVAGLPAISIPCGFTSEGLPVGLQLVGRPWDEGRLLQIAHAYQLETDWHWRVPNVHLSAPSDS